MVAVNLVRRDSMDHPLAGWLTVAVMVAWSGFALWAYDSTSRRRPVLLIADLAVALTAILISAYVQGPDVQATLPGFWVMGVVLAWGIRWHWVGGVVAASLICVADLSIRPEVDGATYGNLFLLMIGGPILGYTTGLLKDMAEARDRAERAAAAAAERARLARVVHDGVLQVLALVQRRGRELGGESAELGRLAGEQEVALRALVQQAPLTAGAETVASGDLARSLSLLQTPTVSVSVPGSPVSLPAEVVGEVSAAVRACLDNVERHAGPDARAWVLLEELANSVVVTVRDSGAGIDNKRLDAAEAEGRLGVTESIRGRIVELGGRAELVSGPGQGTEWELTIPK